VVSVLFAGGGTTGHISPMLAIARELVRRVPNASVTMLGTPEGLETRLVPQAGFPLETIEKVPAPRKLGGAALRFPKRFSHAVKSVIGIIDANDVDVVVGVGGYVATPAYLAARKRHLPIVIHEANAVPGLANKLGAKLTDSANIGFTFPGTPLAGHAVGMPMRPEIEAADRHDSAAVAEARTRLGLRPDLPTVVITGGSLGAAAINEACAAAHASFTAAGLQVLHVTGAGKGESVRAAAAGDPAYHVVDYVDGMENAYLAASLIVCRSGAGTVAEVTTVGLPAVYVPLPIGNGEQAKNAAGPVAAGGARLIDNSAFNEDFVRDAVVPLAADSAALAGMEAALAAMDFPRHADRAMVATIARTAGLTLEGDA
jgi:UDP-N-acetylglucosamine--N-acetylmuramyl-(pentapeptide) pyrophosphoryl-undecaprenol N-acetylglucosamine transferase